ncbi:hypothetical protein ACHAPO_011565 [Fusarium lateritium]
MGNRKDIRCQYVQACEKGRAFAARLQSAETSAKAHDVFHEHYYLTYETMGPKFADPKIEVTNLILRSHNVDTNRLSYCEVFSIVRNVDRDYVLMINADAHSGFLALVEAKREKDETAWGCGRLEMSELLWHTWVEEVTRQSKQVSALREALRSAGEPNCTEVFRAKTKDLSVLTYNAGTQGYEAILGSWAGSVLAKLLIDHRAELQCRTVRQVCVVGDKVKHHEAGEPYWENSFSLFMVIE